MSQGFGCHCPERKKPVADRNWIVLDRECNYSYFEYPKGEWHPSAYSNLACLSCGGWGRTKAKFVADVRDGTSHEFDEALGQMRLKGL